MYISSGVIASQKGLEVGTLGSASFGMPSNKVVAALIVLRCSENL